LLRKRTRWRTRGPVLVLLPTGRVSRAFSAHEDSSCAGSSWVMSRAAAACAHAVKSCMAYPLALDLHALTSRALAAKRRATMRPAQRMLAAPRQPRPFATAKGRRASSSSSRSRWQHRGAG
jgi:hypothetical protein